MPPAALPTAVAVPLVRLAVGRICWDRSATARLQRQAAQQCAMSRARTQIAIIAAVMRPEGCSRRRCCTGSVLALLWRRHTRTEGRGGGVRWWCRSPGSTPTTPWAGSRSSTPSTRPRGAASASDERAEPPRRPGGVYSGGGGRPGVLLWLGSGGRLAAAPRKKSPVARQGACWRRNAEPASPSPLWLSSWQTNLRRIRVAAMSLRASDAQRVCRRFCS